MSLAKTTSYAPDIFRSLNGFLAVYKPVRMSTHQLNMELREKITDNLNEFRPRPIATRLLIEGGVNDEKHIVEAPNLADHPLVVGPRYAPWELALSNIKPVLGFRSSGISVVLLGTANKRYCHKLRRLRFVNVYHLQGKFGHMTDTFFYDGKVKDKTTYKHIRSGKLDAALFKIESSQRTRLFDAAAVDIHSEEAYELAKSWPSRPPRMAKWPVIYRIRCIHLKVPEFKLEVTCMNENESFLAQLVHDVGLMMKSSAYTESIRRVKLGPFDVNESLTDREWDLQSVIKNLSLHNQREDELDDYINQQKFALKVSTEHHMQRPEHHNIEDHDKMKGVNQ